MQKYWETIGDEVCLAVEEFFNISRMLRGINHTIITLIPKIHHVSTMKDLRPISLCNVIHKIISKVLTSRMQHIMNRIISLEQSAFTKGRLISYNNA